MSVGSISSYSRRLTLEKLEQRVLLDATLTSGDFAFLDADGGGVPDDFDAIGLSTNTTAGVSVSVSTSDGGSAGSDDAITALNIDTTGAGAGAIDVELFTTGGIENNFTVNYLGQGNANEQQVNLTVINESVNVTDATDNDGTIDSITGVTSAFTANNLVANGELQGPVDDGSGDDLDDGNTLTADGLIAGGAFNASSNEAFNGGDVLVWNTGTATGENVGGLSFSDGIDLTGGAAADIELQADAAGESAGGITVSGDTTLGANDLTLSLASDGPTGNVAVSVGSTINVDGAGSLYIDTDTTDGPLNTLSAGDGSVAGALGGVQLGDVVISSSGDVAVGDAADLPEVVGNLTIGDVTNSATVDADLLVDVGPIGGDLSVNSADLTNPSVVNDGDVEINVAGNVTGDVFVGDLTIGDVGEADTGFFDLAVDGTAGALTLGTVQVNSTSAGGYVDISAKGWGTLNGSSLDFDTSATGTVDISATAGGFDGIKFTGSVGTGATISASGTVGTLPAPDDAYSIYIGGELNGAIDTGGLDGDVYIGATSSGSLTNAGPMGLLEIHGDFTGTIEAYDPTAPLGNQYYDITEIHFFDNLGASITGARIVADTVGTITVDGNILPDALGTAAVQILPDTDVVNVGGYAGNLWIYGGPDSVTIDQGVGYLTIGGYAPDSGSPLIPRWDVGTVSITGDAVAYSGGVGSQLWIWGNADTVTITPDTAPSGEIFIDGELGVGGLTVAGDSGSIHVGALAENASITTEYLVGESYIYLTGIPATDDALANDPRSGGGADATNTISVYNNELRLFSAGSLGDANVLTGNWRLTDDDWLTSSGNNFFRDDGTTGGDLMFDVNPVKNPGYGGGTDDYNDQHADADPWTAGSGSGSDWAPYDDGIYGTLYYRGFRLIPGDFQSVGTQDYSQEYITFKDAYRPDTSPLTRELPVVDFGVVQGTLQDITVDAGVGATPADATGIETSTVLLNSIHVAGGNLSFLFVHGTDLYPGNLEGTATYAGLPTDIDPDADTREWSLAIDAVNGAGDVTGARIRNYTTDGGYTGSARHITVERDNPYAGEFGVERPADGDPVNLNDILGVITEEGAIKNIYVAGDVAGDIVAENKGIDLLVIDGESQSYGAGHGLYSTVHAQGTLGNIDRIRADSAYAYMQTDLTGGGARIIVDGLLGIVQDQSGVGGSTPDSDWAVWIGRDEATYNIGEELFDGGDGFAITGNELGTQTGLYYYDADGSGSYTFGEDIWKDETGGTAGQYDAGTDTQVYDGGDVGGYQVVGGESGSQRGLYYDDADGGDDYDVGEDIWVDGRLGYIRTIEGSSAGVRTRIHAAVTDLWSVDMSSDFSAGDIIDLPYDNDLYLQVEGNLKWDPNYRNDYNRDGNLYPTNNRVLIGEHRDGANEGLGEDAPTADRAWTMAPDDAGVGRRFTVDGTYNRNIYFFNEGDLDDADDPTVTTYDGDDERIEYIEYKSVGGSATVDQYIYKGQIDRIEFISGPAGADQGVAVNVTTKSDASGVGFSDYGRIQGTAANVLAVAVDGDLFEVTTVGDYDIVGAPFGLEIPVSGAAWDGTDPDADEGFLALNDSTRWVDWNDDQDAADPTAVVSFRGFISRVTTGPTDADLMGDVVALSGGPVELVEVTGDVNPQGIDIYSQTDIEQVEIAGSNGTVSIHAGGTIEIVTTNGDIGEVEGSTDGVQTQLLAGGTIGYDASDNPVPVIFDAWNTDDVLDAGGDVSTITILGFDDGGTKVDLAGEFVTGGTIEGFDLRPDVDNVQDVLIRGNLGMTGLEAPVSQDLAAVTVRGMVYGPISGENIGAVEVDSFEPGSTVTAVQSLARVIVNGNFDAGLVTVTDGGITNGIRVRNGSLTGPVEIVAANGDIGPIDIDLDLDTDPVASASAPVIEASGTIDTITIGRDATGWLKAGTPGDGTADFTGGVFVGGQTGDLYLEGDLAGASPAFESTGDVGRLTIAGDLIGDDVDADADVLVDGVLEGLRVEGALLTSGASTVFKIDADEIGRLFVQEQLTTSENLAVTVPWMYFASPNTPEAGWQVDMEAPVFRSNPLTVSLDLDDFSLVDNYRQDGSNRFYYWHDPSTIRSADIVYDLDDTVPTHSLTADFELDEVRASDNQQDLLSVTFSNLSGVLIASVRPTVDTFTYNIEPTTDPAQDIELVATVSDLDGTVSEVEFYRDVDGDDALDTSVDTLLGTDDDGTDGWSIFSTTGDWDEGSNTLFARAEDDQTVRSQPASTDVTTSDITNTPDLIAGDDSGIDDTDNLTNVNQELTFDVGNTIAGATVNLYIDGTLMGTASGVAGTTQVSMDSSFTLTDGSYQVMARQGDFGGGEAESPYSTELTITVDTAAPGAPDPADLQAASDSGVSDTDNITNDDTPTFDISGVDPVDYYRVYADDGTLTQISGDYEAASPFTAPSLADDVYDVTVTTVDAAGNESTASSPLEVTIDTTAPAAPAAPDLQAGSDSGAFDNDNITNDTAPVFDFTSTDAYFRFYIDAVQDSGDYESGGSYATSGQTEGQHDYTVSGVDAAGNESPQSAAETVDIDLTGPGVTGVTPSGTVGSTVSSIVVDYNDTNGHGMWVSTVEDAANYGLVSSGGDGTFGDGNEVDFSVNIQDPLGYLAGGGGAGAATATISPDLTDGHYQLTIDGTSTVRDLAGNALNDGADETAEFTVDAVAPTVSVDLQAGSDTGQDDDNLTNAQTLIYDVTVNEPGLVSIDWDGDGAVDPEDVVDSSVAAAGTTQFTVVGLPEGLQQVDVTFTDTASNTATASDPTIIDRTGPTVEAFDPTVGVTTDSITTIDVDFFDANTMDTTTVKDTNNYVLVASGGDGTFADGNETNVSDLITSVSYDSVDQVATLNLVGPLPDSHYQLTVDGTTTILDAAGNALNDGADETSTFIVDTSGPPTVTVDLQDGSDTGVSNSDDLTNATDLTYDVDVDEPGNLEIDWEDDGNVDVTAVLDDPAATYSFTVNNPAEGVLPVDVTFTDTAGNTDTAGLPTTVDRTGPTVEGVIPAGIAVTDVGTIEVDFSDLNPLWESTVTDVTNYVLENSGGDGTFGEGNEQDVSSLFDTPISYDIGTQTATIPLTSNLADEVYRLTVLGTTTVRDAAGNALNDGADHTATFTVDAAGPPTVDVDLRAASDSGFADDDNVTNAQDLIYDIQVSEPGTIEIDWEGDGIIDLTDSLLSAGTYDFTASGLPEGTQPIEVSFTDLAANTTDADLPTTIDRTAPGTPGSPDLQPGSDSGVSQTDNITRFQDLDFDLLSTDTYFRFYADSSQVSANYETGTTFGVVGQTEGGHTYRVSGVDLAGNESSQSAALPVTIDLTAPGVPVAPDLQAGSDSGISETDDITNDSSPTFDVSPTEGYFRFYRTGTQVSGDFESGTTYTASGEPEGNWDYTVTSLDVAGNESAASGALGVVLDYTAPSAPPAPDLDPASDAVDETNNATDNRTNDPTPEFIVDTGAGEYFRLYRDGTLVSVAPIVGDDGQIYKDGASEELPEQPRGLFDFTATRVDVAGNESAASGPLEVELTGVWLLARREVEDGVWVSFYDADPQAGTDVIDPDIAWNWGQFNRGDDIVVNPGFRGDQIVNQILLLGPGSETEDLGIMIEGNDRVWSIVDARYDRRETGFVASEGSIGFLLMHEEMIGGKLNTLDPETDWVIPNDLDGDGEDNDRTAIYTDGSLGTAIVLDHIEGDVVVEDDVNNTVRTVGGDFFGDVAIGGNANVLMAIDTGAGGGTFSGNVDVDGRLNVLQAIGGDIDGDHVNVGRNLNFMQARSGDINSAINVGVNAGTILAVGSSPGGDINGPIDVHGRLNTLLAINGNLNADVDVGGSMNNVYVGRSMTGDLSVSGTLGRIRVDDNVTGSSISVGNDLYNLSIGDSLQESDVDVGDDLYNTFIRNDFDNSSLSANPLGSVFVGGRIVEDGTDGDSDFISSREPFWLGRPVAWNRIDEDWDGDDINGVELRIGVV